MSLANSISPKDETLGQDFFVCVVIGFVAITVFVVLVVCVFGSVFLAVARNAVVVRFIVIVVGNASTSRMSRTCPRKNTDM